MPCTGRFTGGLRLLALRRLRQSLGTRRHEVPSNSLPPWASGPGEILGHGIGFLREDTDTNRRLAMIAIDNAVELTIKTYVGLPKRITGFTFRERN